MLFDSEIYPPQLQFMLFDSQIYPPQLQFMLFESEIYSPQLQFMLFESEIYPPISSKLYQPQPYITTCVKSNLKYMFLQYSLQKKKYFPNFVLYYIEEILEWKLSR